MNFNCIRIVLFLGTFALIAYGRIYPESLADHPFIVAVTIKSDDVVVRQCTGTIVSENHVFTSMRCVFIDDKFKLGGFVRAGYDVLDTQDFGDRHLIKEVYYHDRFDNTDFRNNVAVIAVYSFFDFITYINEIPMNWDFLYELTQVRIIGFMGDESQSHKEIQEYITATVPIDDCRATYSGARSSYIHSETLCVARIPDLSLCDLPQGVVLLKHNKLIAVLAHDPNSCRTGAEPYLFTLIAHYTLWMNKIIDPQIFNVSKTMSAP